jgi:tetratricopeptide (TPR) repeat protein
MKKIRIKMSKKYVLFIGLLVISLLICKEAAYAQIDNDLVAEADAAYNIGAKSLALDNYHLALRENPNNIRANFMAGKSIIETIDKGRASKYLIRAYELDANISPDILYLIGQSFQFGKDFNNAILYYEKHKEKIQADALKNTKIRKSTVKAMLAEIDYKIAQCNNGKNS